MSDDASQAGYVVPTYQEADHTPWYHFLHGNVPGHQIDFMYRAEVPQGPLTRQHFSHLARLMKYIEPQAGCPYAFAIGNLSRDDTQHEPGHGGVALMFGLRIQGVTDHAGRQDPPFAHAVAAIDRDLDRTELLATAGVFHRHVLAAAQSAEWYRSYVRCAAEAPAGMTEALEEYVAEFSDLPSPPPSSLGLKWTVGESTPPPRIVIVHDDDAPFGMIAACAAKIAAVLFPSDIRWSAISNGREADLPNGVTVRLVAASNVTAADEARGVHRIEEVPDDEEEIAQQLFGAGSATVVEKPVARGWRDKYAGANAGGDESSADVQRASYAAEAPMSRRTPAPAQPAANPFDAVVTNVWDRAGPGTEVHGEIEVDVDRASSEGAAPAQPRSTPPPALGNRAAMVDVARPSPAPSQEYEPDGARETRTISVEEARAALKAALPFTPAPAPAPLAASPTNDRELAPNFRKSTLSWKGPAIGLGLGAILIVVLYLVLSGDPEKPAPDPQPQPTVAAPVPMPTHEPIATVAPTPTVAPKATVAPRATAPRPTSPPRKPVRKKPGSVFDGSL
jgi:hypothetical protein